MEPREIKTNTLDNAITDALRERIGTPPSRKVWAGIEREIICSSRRRPSWWNSLLFDTMFRGPVAQSALILVVTAVLIVQPALYWMYKYDEAVPTVVPYSPQGRPLPEGELRTGEMVGEGHTVPVEMPMPPVTPL